MPTYEYECQKCGHRFEEFQSMTAKPLTRCPECKGKVKRLIGAGAGFLFKGSGFYTTDYRSSAYQEKKKGDTASKSGGDGASSAAPAKPVAPPSEKPKPERPKSDKKGD